MPTTGRRAEHRERVARVLDLHVRGLSVRDVAAEIGCTPARAARLIAEGVATMPAQDVADIRATSELRLDRAARVYGALLDSEDERVRADAARGLITVERDRARLLGSNLPPLREA